MSNNNFISTLRTSMVKHSPEILTGLGIAGFVTTTILAVRATPKALNLLKEAEERYLESSTSYAAKSNWVDNEGNEVQIFKPLEKVRIAWKCYIPTVIMGTVSVTCILGANSVNLRRNAALATAYTISEAALTDYRHKVVEVVGEKKEKEVRDAIAKDIVDKTPVINKEIVVVEQGGTLCLDVYSGRFFKSDIEKIRKAVNRVNRDLLNDGYLSLNDFYYEIGLSNVAMGEDFGWIADRGVIDVNFSSQLTADGTPCIVLDYSIAPFYGYYERS